MGDTISGRRLDMINSLNLHIEEFAAAFMKHTNLPPDRVVMKVKITADITGYTQTIWFEECEEETRRFDWTIDSRGLGALFEDDANHSG